ncbi:MAG TPA: hypothetical protein VND96_20215 [Candidatus Micrarchaeaceae archaeon]|nr:hypothetical protein [Candidatus Micrarchaeaceae archaeon]
MKVVTLRDFRDRATEMMRSRDILLVTRDGKPAGFFLPWDRPDLPDDIRKGIYAELSQRAGRHLDKKGVTEEEILADFSAARRSRR